jgi:hypothetical protein
MNDKKIGYYGLLTVLALVGGMFVFSFVDLLNVYSTDRHGIIVKGKVVQIEHQLNTDEDALVFWVEYKYNSNNYLIHNRMMDSDSIYKLHEFVDIKILQTNPEKGIINSFKDKYSGNLYAMVICGVVIFFGGIILLKMREYHS